MYALLNEQDHEDDYDGGEEDENEDDVGMYEISRKDRL